MINIDDVNKVNCCGCTACVNRCPVSAIKMQEDFEGFQYPTVDMEKCINCGLCEKVCPVIAKSRKEKIANNYKEIISYVIRTKNEECLRKSTSGGFFTPIANYVLNNDGLVVGVGYDEKMKVCHMIVNKLNTEKLKNMKGSKYVQSDLGNIFSEIKNKLDKDIFVLFSGTPCQVEGLLYFLGKNYNNLLTVDLICHGVPSPKLWNLYKEHQESKYKSKIKAFNFRNKTYGYHSGTMKLEFENNKVYYGSARVDYMLKSFFSEISSRPSCYDCKFKSKHHKSDFTIFDCWHARELNNNILDDDKGFTNLFINTSKGKDFFERVKAEYELYNSNYEDAIRLDGCMVESSAIPNNNRNDFYKDINKYGLKQTINKYIPIKTKDYLFEKIKGIIYKLKILQIIKKVVKK